MKYKYLSFLLYFVMMNLFCIKIKSYPVFDVYYYSHEILYFILSGIFITLFIFRFDIYNHYLKEYGSYEIIRYKSKKNIYFKFILNCIIDSLVLTILKIIIELIVLDSINLLSELMFFVVILILLLIHFYLEILISSKNAIMIIVMYLSISFSFGDLLKRLSMEKINRLFILNLICPSRIDDYHYIVYLIIMIIMILRLSYVVLKEKEIL